MFMTPSCAPSSHHHQHAGSGPTGPDWINGLVLCTATALFPRKIEKKVTKVGAEYGSVAACWH
jgi:hypothetical protein